MCGGRTVGMEREVVSVPYSLLSGKYLGTASRILLAGSLPNQTSRLDLVNLSTIDAASPTINYQSNLISSCSLKGICTAIDVFGHSSLGKSFAAIATQQNGSGQLSIFEIPSDSSHNGNGDLKFREIHQQFQIEDSIYTSITSHSNNNQLTACTEFGDVIIHDYSGYEITRFNADYCGLNAIKYSNSGDLITLGMSSGGQLSLWDTRSSSQSAALVRCLRPPISSSSSSTISYLTSVLTSHRNDYDLICGTSTGSIIQWDTRSEGVIFSPHQVHSMNASVTSLAPHPADCAAIISGGSDGSIACMEYDLFTTAGSRTKPSFLSSSTSAHPSFQPSHQQQQQFDQDSKLKILSDVYEIPMKECVRCHPHFSSSVMSLDSSDMTSKKVLATGRLGEVSFLNL